MKLIRTMSLLAAGAVLAGSSIAAMAQTIVVGGKNFTEQQIMAAMTAQLLKAKGFNPEIKAGMGSAVLRQAQESGQIDVYWEYTGTSLITYNKVSERLSAPDTYKRVKELDAAKGLVWLNPSAANNTYSLAMNADEAKKNGIVTISDLAAKVKGGSKLTMASNAETEPFLPSALTRTASSAPSSAAAATAVEISVFRRAMSSLRLITKIRFHAGKQKAPRHPIRAAQGLA